MRLYIANCTRQTMQLHYRLDFQNDGEIDPRRQAQQAKQQTIGPGRQEVIGGDLHLNQIQDIVDQLEKYGLRAVKEIPELKTTVRKLDPNSRATVPMVFNVDRNVPLDAIKTVMSINSNIQVGQGVERRRRAAVAVPEIIQNRVNEEFAQAGLSETATDNVQTAFEQLEQSEAGEKTIAEGYKIDKNAPAELPPSASRRRRRSA